MHKVDEAENDSEEISDELEDNQLVNINRHFKNRKNHRGSKSNSQTEAMYKEALMDVIFGRFAEASKKLKLIITLSPDNPEPYHLLANMHDQIGQSAKAVEYLFMSTYLSPPNLQKWIKVADISFDLKMYNQAAYCYGRALKIENYNISIMLKRAQAFQLSHEIKRAILMYKKILNISKSLDVIKRYAKLRFKRGQYGLCRQILESYDENYFKNQQIIFMICQVYLKQKKYHEINSLLNKYFEQYGKQSNQSEQIPVEFLKMMFITATALKITFLDFTQQELYDSLIDTYEKDYNEIYSDIISHTKQFDETITFKFLVFLFKKEAQQTIDNYLFVTDYLCKNKDQKNAIFYIEEAIELYPNSAELSNQYNYIKNLFNINRKTIEEQQIFYSDEQDKFQPQYELNIFENENQNKVNQNTGVKPKKQKKKCKQIETEDPKVISRLLQNSIQSLKIILSQIQNLNTTHAYKYNQVIQSLDYLTGLSTSHRQAEEEQKDELYQNKVKRRRIQDQKKKNFIFQNIEAIISYLQLLIEYMVCLLKQKQYKKIVQIAESISKAHFLKNQNKKQEFKQTKIKIYQISLLACLSLKKFNSAIFFMRYLINRFPENQLYLLILHFLMRNCRRKTFISSMLNKLIDYKNSQNIDSLVYLLGIEYMQTGCFQLAASSLLKISNRSKDKQLLKSIYLCLAASLIQIASSRNTFNKLDFTNRSAYCFAKYSSGQQDNPQVIFNRARWFAQVKINHKAINYFKKILEIECSDLLKQKAAYNLLCIYRNNQDYQKMNQISKQYFLIPQSA